MGRARRARNIAATAAYGGGLGAAGLAGVGLTAWAVLRGEAAVARRVVGTPFDGAPDDSGRYGAGPGDPIRLLMLGDSTAKGMGADDAHETVGAIIATATAAITGRPVELRNVAAVGAVSCDLDAQLDRALEEVPRPDLALIMVGANDITKSVARAVSVRHLSTTVSRLREADAEVVVATCPDLGVVEPLPQPLRLLVRRWSRDLAAAQTVAVIEQGGRTVSLGDLLGEEFRATPQVLFSKDRFHPSAAGYARAASAILPSVLDALEQRTGTAVPVPVLTPGAGSGMRRPTGVGPVAEAATQAVRAPGTEVSATEVGGQERGARGRWARLLRRQRQVLPDPTPQDPGTDDAGPDAAAASGRGTRSGGDPV